MEDQVPAGPEFGKDGMLTILAGLTCTVTGPALFGFYTFTLFMTELADEFGWSRAALSGAISAGTLAVAASAPPIARMIDRYGSRAVISGGIICSGLALASLYAIGPYLMGIYFAFALIGVTCSAYFVGIPRMISQMFVRRQGLAIGLVMAGAGVGTFVLMPMLEYLIRMQGWRTSYLALGLVVLATFVPFRLLSRQVGTATAARVAEVKKAVLPVPIAQYLKTKAFILTAACFFLCGIALHGFLVHFVPVLVSLGVEPAIGASLFGVSGLAIVAGRLGCGYLADHFKATTVGACVLGLAGLGLLLLLAHEPSYFSLLVIATLFGLGIGAEMDVLMLVVSRNFPDNVFSRLYAAAYAVFMIGTSIGPFAVGLAFDRSGSYIAVIAVAGLGSIVAALFLYLASEPHRPDALEFPK